MIDDPELLQLVNAATELMTLQAFAVFVQRYQGDTSEMHSIMDTFNSIQQMLVEAMSRRIVELALLHHDSMEPPKE